MPLDQLQAAVLVGVDSYRWLRFLQKKRAEDFTIHCFEPNPALYHQLKRSFSDIKLYQGSLSEEEQVDSYIHYLDQAGSAAKKLNGLKDQVNVLVKSFPLTSILSLEDQVDLIVVDRGFTIDRIVQGALPIIEAQHPALVFQQSAYAQSFHAGQTFDLLTAQGYDIRLLSAPKGEPLFRKQVMAIRDKVLIAQ